MPKSPLAEVKERFENKEGLVAALRALATEELWNGRRLNEDKGLDHVSNAKLLHLHAVLSEVSKEHGSRAGLIDSLITLEKRSKDEGYRTHLEGHSTPELLALYKAAKKRAK